MAMNSRASTELLIPKKWHDRATSPQRTTVMAEPKSVSSTTDIKVPVIYYLSRNGHLEHPHFMEVPLSASHGLYLRDVINRLNYLRGKGMANKYSWSSKRSFRNGYVWHDLSENDLITPINGREYVLKGSELLRGSVSFRSHKAMSTEPNHFQENSHSSKPSRRSKNKSWSSFDFPEEEYLVYKSESSRELSGKLIAAVDAATQTGEKSRPIRNGRGREEKTALEVSVSSANSSSSLVVIEGVNKSSKVDQEKNIQVPKVENGNEFLSRRMKASQVLRRLITCGSTGSTKSKETQMCI